MRSIRILVIALVAALAACNIYFDDSGRHSTPDAGSDVPPDGGDVPDAAVDGGFPFPDAPPSDGGCDNDGGGFPDAAEPPADGGEPPADGGSAPDGHCC